MNPWTEERTELAVKLWNDGESASDIARRLNCGAAHFSRNSVIGKIHRLGMSGRRKVTRKYGKRPKQARKPRNPAFRYGRPLTAAQEALRKLKQEALPPPAETDIARVSFADMEPHLHCRFIPGVPSENFKMDAPMYCGHTPVKGTPYCKVHAQRCFDTVRTDAKISMFKPAAPARTPLRSFEPVE
jgi:GcrA cell cycle regulator